MSECDSPAPTARLGDILPLRVLAADDVATNRVALAFLCRSLGYQAEVVDHGAQVLDRLSQRDYDLVLLDIEMPVLNGVDLAREICRRQADPTSRPKLVAITATVDIGHREQCLAAGFDEYLNKPLLAETLRRCIWRLFRKRLPRTTASLPAQLPPAPEPEPPPWLDDTALSQLAQELPAPEAQAIIEDMRVSLLQDLATARTRLDELCRSRAASEAANVLHAVKGGVLAVGWTRMGHWCHRELVALRTGNFTGWDTLTARFDEYFQTSNAMMAKRFPADRL